GAHGTQGWVKVGSYSGELDHLVGLTELKLRCGETEHDLAVEGVRPAHREILMKLAGIDSRDDAQRLHGCELWVDRSAAAPCGEDEFYVADLVGCALYGEGENVIAHVVGVWDSGVCDMLEVETLDGKTYNVPFREPFVGEVDVRKRHVELKAPWVLA
ncbi:MAG: ribosome maturation factor RimM, partial [Spirochaetota bacterium]